MLRRIQDRNIWVIYSAILLLGIAYGVSIAVLAIHLARHDIPKVAMGGLAAAFAFGIISFSIPAGWLVQRVGAKKMLAGALLGYAACVASFPFLETLTQLSIARFFDGAFSVGIWVAAETTLLARADESNKAFVMSVYAMSLALGYVVGPLLSAGIVGWSGTAATFVTAGVLAVLAALVVFTQLARDSGRSAHESTSSGEPSGSGLAIFWRIKTSCFATFSYGYFQSSVVLFLPLYLIQSKGIEESKTILITAFFAAGMLIATTWVGRLGDRYGHLLVMRVLGMIGGLMVASFVLLSSFAMMCGAVFVAGATLASISPVSLALQGVVTPKRDLGKANAFYNAAYAAGMLTGPPLSSLLFTHGVPAFGVGRESGGGAMLLHLAALWAGFVIFTVVFASDDPRRSSSLERAPTAAGEPEREAA